MWTRTLRQGLTACTLAVAVAGAALPLRAETDTTGVGPRAETDSTGVVLRLEADSTAARHLVATETGDGSGASLASVGAKEATPTTLGARFRPGTVVVWHGQTTAGADRPRSWRGVPRRDALCAVLTLVNGRDASEDAARIRRVVSRVTAGYELSPTRRLSLSPRMQRIRGQSLTGFSMRLWGI